MLRFSLKAAFLFILLAALVCTVLFAVPEHVRIAILFLGVLALPGPLAVVARQGGRQSRAFALGGLIAYGAWFVLVGIPAGLFAAQQFGAYMAVPLSSFRSSVLPGGSGNFIVPTYLLFAGLYAPWFIVPLAGLASVLGQFICVDEQRE
jgi:hypothetical protein